MRTYTNQTFELLLVPVYLKWKSTKKLKYSIFKHLIKILWCVWICIHFKSAIYQIIVFSKRHMKLVYKYFQLFSVKGHGAWTLIQSVIYIYIDLQVFLYNHHSHVWRLRWGLQLILFLLNIHPTQNLIHYTLLKLHLRKLIDQTK